MFHRYYSESIVVIRVNMSFLLLSLYLLLCIFFSVSSSLYFLLCILFSVSYSLYLIDVGIRGTRHTPFKHRQSLDGTPATSAPTSATSSPRRRPSANAEQLQVRRLINIEYPWNCSSRFSSNFLKHSLVEMFYRYYMHSDLFNIFKSSTIHWCIKPNSFYIMLIQSLY